MVLCFVSSMGAELSPVFFSSGSFCRMFSIAISFFISSGFDASFLGVKIFLISSSGVKAYFHIIFSWNLKGIAKSLIFWSATRIAGPSFS